MTSIMIHKTILPESFNFDVPSVEIIGVGCKGLDKTAMVKRASAFDDILPKIEKKANATVLHVITTGACESYGCNRNGDAFNGESFTDYFPEPENKSKTSVTYDGGLSKYHDSSYMSKDAAVYQEHHTKRNGVEPSGKILAARYNKMMKRGELLIEVDNKKWAKRLQKKANGQDIFLSIGCDVNHDTCCICGRVAHTTDEHCDHFKKQRTQVLSMGKQACVMNDSPKFYDISGVDVPADKIAFVLTKIASGESEHNAIVDAMMTCGTRQPMLLTKAAMALDKLSKLEKKITGIVSDDDFPEEDSEEAKDDFLAMLENYPADEVVDSCNRKGILLSPSMLFKLLGKDSEDASTKIILCNLDDDCCGDCSNIIENFKDSESCSDELLDGAFDNHFPADLNLDNILNMFMPEFGMTEPMINRKIIKITITARPKKAKKQNKEASYKPAAIDALRDTYARYLVSFAERNSDSTCFNALRKVAKFGK